MSPSPRIKRPSTGGAVPRTWRTRVWFVWAIISGGVLTIILSILFFIHNLVRPGARTFQLWMTRWSRSIIRAIGVNVEVEKRGHLVEGRPYVFVPNHQNMLDIVACGAGIPHPYRFVAKGELRRMPFIGKVLERSSCVFVDRSSPRKAVQSVQEAADLIRSGASVLIYPEGVRNYGGELQDFQRGAFVLAVKAGAPLVPVVQVDNHRLIDERHRRARTGTTHMVICDPIPTESLTSSDVPALSEQVREVMARELAARGATAAEGASEAALSSTHP